MMYNHLCYTMERSHAKWLIYWWEKYVRWMRHYRGISIDWSVYARQS